MKKILSLLLVVALLFTMGALFTGCDEYVSGTAQDTQATINNANKLQTNQPTPTDIDYSLERYNLIRRAYWVNGQRERAINLPCEIEKPLGYIVLFSSNTVVGNFIVDGKVSSLNSFLTPDSEYYEFVTGSTSTYHNNWLADVDGSYGANDNGIFFFTPDGKYIEWTGSYLYSDIPFVVDKPVIEIKAE
jgi:hypothetical protein